MKRVIEAFASAVTSRPRIAILVLAAFTAVLLFGFTLMGPQADNDAFLPGDSDVAEAVVTRGGAFPDSAGLTNVAILHRGDFLTPEGGLTQVERVIASSVDEPAIAERLALTNPVVSVADGFKQATRGRRSLLGHPDADRRRRRQSGVRDAARQGQW